VSELHEEQTLNTGQPALGLHVRLPTITLRRPVPKIWVQGHYGTDHDAVPGELSGNGI
jgi:hypothetical protein